MNSQELMHEYLNGVAALRQATDGLTADQSRARPVPGKWSTLEVVCHLADIDALDAERMKSPKTSRRSWTPTRPGTPPLWPTRSAS
jgi:DinB superfamily